MKKKFLSFILTAALATTIGTASTLTTQAAVTDTSSVSASQYEVSTPKFNSIENIDNAVKLSWKSVPGAYKYRVYYKGRNGWTKFAETTGINAVDDVVRSGETYTYTIRALDKHNNFVSDFNHSGWRHTYVSVPKFNKIENVDGQVKLSWNRVDGAYKYRVYYKGRNGWTKFAETTDTTAIDDVVKSGTTYTYTIRALDKNNNFVSDFYRNGWKHTYVSVPKFNKIENTDGQVNLSWNSVDGAYKYRVYYKGRNGWTKFAETTGTTAVDDVVRSGVTYTYTVRALDKNNNFVSDFNHSGWRHTYVSNPKFSKIENIDGGVKLSWNSVDGAYKYRVYYKGRNGWTKFAETTDTKAIDDVVKSGTTYTYTVRALDENDNFVSDFNHSGWQHTYIATPKITNLENTIEGIKITWDKVDGAEYYRVFYKDSDGWKHLTTTSDTSFIDTDVKAGNTYTYTVRCIDSMDNYISDYVTSGWQIKRLEWHDAVYEYIEHPAETESVWIIDQSEYTYEEGIYEYHDICKGCVDKASAVVGYRIWDIEETDPRWYAAFQMAGINPFLDEMSEEEDTEHGYNHMINGENDGYYYANVRVGTQTITVPEEGHWETVVIKEAWTEQVLVKEAGWY